MNELTIRHGRLEDLEELQKLFVGTISTICSKDYDSEQICVWTSSIENKDRWLDILTNQYLLVAQTKEYRIVGFGSLDKGDYIDLIYIHKDCQGQKIASKIYDSLEKEAIRLGKMTLSSDVSITARQFFERKGFNIIKEQRVLRQGVELTNFKMEKEIF